MRFAHYVLLFPLFASSLFAAENYGVLPTIKAASPLAQAVKNFDGKNSSTKEIAVTGTVEKLCQEKGCWMVIKDGDTQVRVTFKNYGFFVKPTVMGKAVTAQGVLIQKDISKAEAIHYLVDQGMSRQEAEKVGVAKKEMTFVASGVVVSGA